MEELTYPTLSDQTKAMVEQLKNHKGKKNNIIIFVHKFKKKYFSFRTVSPMPGKTGGVLFTNVFGLFRTQIHT